ncbi:hypothetical protein [Streptomyces sp. C10-9-1]|uniref:hypothetical protein n=1 Tax=Streptomyces sp. C10-9-1 TaxID=1859285 RepID=UPI003D75BBC4
MNDAGHRLPLRLVASGAVALSLLAGLPGAARADGNPPGRGWEAETAAGYRPGEGPGTVAPAGACEFSLDGVTWRSRVKVGPTRLKPGKDGTVRVRVRAAGRGSCTASLASYRTHGPTWKSSGLQVFHDWDTLTVAGGARGVLRIAVPDAGCFGQVDLYRDDVVYDGLLDARDGRRHGPLPQGPDRPVIKERLITAWNGGTRSCVARPVPNPSVSAPAPAPSSPAEPTAPPPSVPGAGASPPGTSPVPSSPAPASPGTDTGGAGSAPGGHGPGLARTGAGDTVVHTALGLLLVGAGGGLLMLRRRRAVTGTG